ncbi:hypothetical protein FGB62_75g018 [Gracilaria domingensis]|nr:hypothetical protein FGB62_75g018 [Gracilaria domingensis]
MESPTARTNNYTSVDLEGVSFPVNSVLLPKSAAVLVLEHTVCEEGNENCEEVHILSDTPGNIAKIKNKALSDALRKALWRSNTKNRERENQLSRKRYKLSRQSESSHDRNKRLVRRRARCAGERALKSFESVLTESSNSDFTDSTWSCKKCSDGTSSGTQSDAGDSNVQQIAEHSASNSLEQNVLAASCSQSSESDFSSGQKNSSLGESDSKSTQYLYHSEVETKVLKTHNHHRKSIERVPPDAVVLEITEETVDASKSNEEDSNTNGS